MRDLPRIPAMKDAPVVPAGDVLVSLPAAALLVLLAHAPGRRVPWGVALSLLVRTHIDPQAQIRHHVHEHLERARTHHVDDKAVPARLRAHIPAARRHAHGLMRAGWVELTTLDATGTVRAIQLCEPGARAYSLMTNQPCPTVPAEQGLDPQTLTAALMGSSVRPLLTAALLDALSGQWQDKEDVLTQVVGLIPVKVGQEHMRAKITRDAQRRRTEPVFPDDVELIRRGRRDLAQSVLAAMVRDGRVAREGTRVRLGENASAVA